MTSEEEADMSIDEMRKAMQEFCLESRCPSCPVVVVRGLCEEYDWANNAPEDLWANAPKDLIEKAYLLAFGKIKEDKQMNITADEIRKAALQLIEAASGLKCVVLGSTAEEKAKADEMMRLNERRMQITLGYINGVCRLADKLTEGDTENDD